MRTACRATKPALATRAPPPLAALLALLVVGCGGEHPRRGSDEPASRLPAAPRSVGAACRHVAERSAFPVLCPATWPRHRGPGQPKLQLLENAPDTYLIDASNGFSRRGPEVFHLLLGGQRHPVRPGPTGIDPALRLTTRRVTVPMKSGGEFVQALPFRRIDSATVHGNRAAVRTRTALSAGRNPRWARRHRLEPGWARLHRLRPRGPGRRRATRSAGAPVARSTRPHARPRSPETRPSRQLPPARRGAGESCVPGFGKGRMLEIPSREPEERRRPNRCLIVPADVCSPATLPGFRAGTTAANKGLRDPADRLT